MDRVTARVVPVLILAVAALVYGQSSPPALVAESGRLPRSFVPPSPNCLEQPEWQVHQYNPDFFILRESGCLHYEKPFVYMIFGSRRALLLDTGAGKQPKLRGVLESLMEKRAKLSGGAPQEVIVAHSHGHGDHTAGDAELSSMSGFRVIAAKPDALAAAFSIANWPSGEGSIDLGDRVLDVLAIPGHEPASIAVYDRKTAVLLSGDSVYPGRLYVYDWPAYLASIDRLVEFTATRPVAHILGAHIEQSATPFVDYPVGTAYQPDEHGLEMPVGTLLELKSVLAKAGGNPQLIRTRDFSVVPRNPRR